MSDSFYKSEIDRELLLNIEIQKQNLKALPERFKAQKKVVSPVTQQMIDDYKQQFRDSYKRKDDKGTESFYRFLIPEALPTLEIIDKDELLKSGILEETLEPNKIKEANDELTELIDDYNYIEAVIREKYTDIEDNKNNINKLSAERLEIIRNYRKINISKEFDLNTLNKIKNKDIEINNIIESIENLNYDIGLLKIQNNNRQTEINALKKQLEVNDEIKLKNEKVLYTIEQNNKKKLSDYAKTIQMMNNGEISLEQQQGESEADYLKRLSEVALIEEDPTRAYIYNTNQFKKNLKTLIKSEWKIDNLVKSFTNDDQFLLNKTFAGFKKYFNDLYGQGNKDLDVEEYVNIIREYIDSDATSMLKKVAVKEKEENFKRLRQKYVSEDDSEDGNEPIDQELLPGDFQDQETETVVASIVDELPEVEARAIPPPPPPISERTLKEIKISKVGDVLRFENTVNNKNLYFKLEDPIKKSGVGSSNKIVNYSTDNKTYEILGKGPAFNGKLNTQIKSLGLLDTDSDFNVIRYMIGGDKLIISVTDFIDFFNSYKEGSGFKKSKKLKKPKKQLVVQKGASIKDVPNKCEFGKLIILLNKLYHNNILSVKDKNGINVQGIPNSQVGDKFVDIIMKICNNEDINKNDVLVLNDKDAILYSVLMNKSGLKKKYNIDNTKSINALKDRLELVEGEMLAGNTNNDIQKELYDIVFKLANLGAITLSSARKYYKNTSKLMFKN